MSQDVLFESTCVVTAEDHVAASFTHMRPRPWMKVVGFGLLAAVVTVLVVSFPHLYSDGAFSSPTFVLIAAGALYFVVYFVVLVPRRVRSLFAQMKLDGAPVTFAIGSEALELRTSNGTGSLPWNQLHKWREGKRSLLLYRNDAFFVVVPKRCLSSDQVSTLRGLLAQHARLAA